MFVSPSIRTTEIGPRVRISADQGPQTDSTFAIFDLTAARSKISSTGGAMTSTTFPEDGEFGLVLVTANSAVFAFRSGQTIYGVSSNTTRAV